MLCSTCKPPPILYNFFFCLFFLSFLLSREETKLVVFGVNVVVIIYSFESCVVQEVHVSFMLFFAFFFFFLFSNGPLFLCFFLCILCRFFLREFPQSGWICTTKSKKKKKKKTKTQNKAKKNYTMRQAAKFCSRVLFFLFFYIKHG